MSTIPRLANTLHSIYNFPSLYPPNTPTPTTTTHTSTTSTTLQYKHSIVGEKEREERKLPNELNQLLEIIESGKLDALKNPDRTIEPFLLNINQPLPILNENLLHICVRMNQLEILKYLIEEMGAIIDLPNTNNETPFFISIQLQIYQISKYLHKQGADRNGCDSKGWFPIHYIIHYKNLEMLEILLSDMNDILLVDVRNGDGWLPIQMSILNGAYDCFLILFKEYQQRGRIHQLKDVYCPSVCWMNETLQLMTMVDLAYFSKQLDMAEFLLENGFISGNTLLCILFERDGIFYDSEGNIKSREDIVLPVEEGRKWFWMNDWEVDSTSTTTTTTSTIANDSKRRRWIRVMTYLIPLIDQPPDEEVEKKRSYLERAKLRVNSEQGVGQGVGVGVGEGVEAGVGELEVGIQILLSGLACDSDLDRKREASLLAQEWLTLLQGRQREVLPETPVQSAEQSSQSVVPPAETPETPPEVQSAEQPVVTKRVRKWQHDSKVQQCNKCHLNFSLFLRKHHCRWCGLIYCHHCTQHRMPILPGMLLFPHTHSDIELSQISRHGLGLGLNQGLRVDLEWEGERVRVCGACFGEIMGRLGFGFGLVGRGRSRTEPVLGSSNSSTATTSLVTLPVATAVTTAVATAAETTVLAATETTAAETTTSIETNNEVETSSSNSSDTSSSRNRNTHDLLTECPVCNIKLEPSSTNIQEIEHHLNQCLSATNFNQKIISGNTYVAMTLLENLNDDEECVICFEPFLKGERVARMNCFCYFHQGCIDSWFRTGTCCPIHYR